MFRCSNIRERKYTFVNKYTCRSLCRICQKELDRSSRADPHHARDRVRSTTVCSTDRSKYINYRDACINYNDHYSGGYTDRLYANAPLVIFKFVQQHDTVRRLSRLRTDFSYATPRLMHIIRSIYKEFFNADVKIPVPY
jgi:hypothetical protein